MMDKSNTKTPAIKNINDLPLVLTVSEVSELAKTPLTISFAAGLLRAFGQGGRFASQSPRF